MRAAAIAAARVRNGIYERFITCVHHPDDAGDLDAISTGGHIEQSRSVRPLPLNLHDPTAPDACGSDECSEPVPSYQSKRPAQNGLPSQALITSSHQTVADLEGELRKVDTAGEILY